MCKYVIDIGAVLPVMV